MTCEVPLCEKKGIPTGTLENMLLLCNKHRRIWHREYKANQKYGVASNYAQTQGNSHA